MHNTHHSVQLFLSCLVVLFCASSGIKKSIHNLPDVRAYNPQIPERIKLTILHFLSVTVF